MSYELPGWDFPESLTPAERSVLERVLAGESHGEVAQARGISRPLFERATDTFIPDPEVIELAAFQPEHTKAAGAYVVGLVGQARIDAGRQLAATHAELLGAIETAYGVDRHILVAIWGVESRYGTEMGSRNIIRSLATLAMADVRRAPKCRC